MLEKTPKTFNARFEKETMWEIAGLIAAKYGRDKTEAVARAIHEASKRLNGGAVAVSPPATSSESASTLERGFPIMCHRCGEDGARGPTKFGTICFGCKRDGHSNQPAECPVCTAGTSI